MHSMLNYLSNENIIENVTFITCNFITDYTQTTNILCIHKYVYFQVQLFSNINTKNTNLHINALPTTLLIVDGKLYKFNSVVCHHD